MRILSKKILVGDILMSNSFLMKEKQKLLRKQMIKISFELTKIFLSGDCERGN